MWCKMTNSLWRKNKCQQTPGNRPGFTVFNSAVKVVIIIAEFERKVGVMELVSSLLCSYIKFKRTQVRKIQFFPSIQFIFSFLLTLIKFVNSFISLFVCQNFFVCAIIYSFIHSFLLFRLLMCKHSWKITCNTVMRQWILGNKNLRHHKCQWLTQPCWPVILQAVEILLLLGDQLWSNHQVKSFPPVRTWTVLC